MDEEQTPIVEQPPVPSKPPAGAPQAQDKPPEEPAKEAAKEPAAPKGEEKPVPPAKTKKKKTKHTRIVLPGDKKKDKATYAAPKKDRLGRPVGGTGGHNRPPSHSAAASGPAPQPGEGKPAKPQGGAKGKPEAAAKKEAAQPPRQEDELPANAVLLPKRSKGVSAAKRRRLMRRIRLLAVAFAALCIALFVYSGYYLYAGVVITDWLETARISMQKGGGFPMDLTVPGLFEARKMGSGGFVALGNKDMSIVSGSGQELYSIQHGFVNPRVTAGNNRVCVYSRGGKEYSIESRSKTLYHGTTMQEIVFAEMSPGGWLAIVTASSRSEAVLSIYSPTLDPEPLQIRPLSQKKPVALAFQPDNKIFAVASISPQGGTLNTAIEIFRVDKVEAVGSISAAGVVPVKIQYVAPNKLLVLYNTEFAALYDNHGKELARYNYGGQSLATAHTIGSRTALVFGSDFRESVQMVLLDADLQVTASQNVPGNSGLRVLVTKDTAYLLVGQQLRAFSLTGEQLAMRVLDEKPLELLYTTQPLLFFNGRVEALTTMLDSRPASEAVAEGTSVPVSVPSASPPPEVPVE